LSCLSSSRTFVHSHSHLYILTSAVLLCLLSCHVHTQFIYHQLADCASQCLLQRVVRRCCCLLAVCRKGATRAFPPGHPDVPAKYRSIGQPVLIGGSMGTASYVMTGTEVRREIPVSDVNACAPRL
jgi:hypothetical protein